MELFSGKRKVMTAEESSRNTNIKTHISIVYINFVAINLKFILIDIDFILEVFP